MNKMLRRSATAIAVTALAVGALATSAEAAPDTRASALNASTAVSAANDGDPDLTDIYIWATDVNLRSQPTSASPRLAVRSQYFMDAVCQKQGQFVNDPAVGANSWWTAVMEFGGSDVAWVSNLYIRGGEKIAGVPDCTF
ncbi:peptidase M23 [Streptomyces sp. SID12501]|uniref:Peptidase M23 n=1 Tax=Streptomyces sp. SID12501 TaxID=2706042 RepID=A0A6B3BP90_9ACTN|nr:peptidase M23 [Streptomyces sp. SID12501]NEC86153.1 peptidase M23 [Streptomyces sp. SID12501]